MKSFCYPENGRNSAIGFSTPAFVPREPYVLVVDDDYDILSVMLLLLETEGYAALGVQDSQKVLPLLEKCLLATDDALIPCLPAVILLDLMMPVITGYDIARSLARHAHFAALPVIAMTADPTVGSFRAVQGASDLVSKPFHIDLLLSKVARYISPAVLF